MLKVFELVFKDRDVQHLEMAYTDVLGAGMAPGVCAIVTHMLPGLKQAAKSTYSLPRNVETL